MQVQVPRITDQRDDRFGIVVIANSPVKFVFHSVEFGCVVNNANETIVREVLFVSPFPDFRMSSDRRKNGGRVSADLDASCAQSRLRGGGVLTELARPVGKEYLVPSEIEEPGG